MNEAKFDERGSRIRWTETAGRSDGDGGATVYVHGLGAMSAPYHAHIAADPALAGRRSLFVDLPGHGTSDRPADFGYTLEDHADALAVVLDEAGVRGGELVGHSMGGAVAVVLAHRRPDLVARLVLTEANLDPYPPGTSGSAAISSWTEEAFVHGGGFAHVLGQVRPMWASTMRLADPVALHRTATGLMRGTEPTMRRMLMESTADRTYLQGALSGELLGADELMDAGVRVLNVADAGHCIMFDRPDALVEAIAARS